MILFVGNSFTYGFGSPVRFYRADSVVDLNNEGIGGVPALFKSFTLQSGLTYDVYLETHPGVGLNWHVDNKLAKITAQRWDQVVLQGYSTLDPKNPGNPTVQTRAVATLAAALRRASPAVKIHVTATWPRADEVYDSRGHWYGKTVEIMADDLQAGTEKATEMDPSVKDIVPVGSAWVRAFRSGFADANPYDGIEPGKVDLWTFDHFHASVFGYYLEALVLFGTITGHDPRELGASECSGFELGLSMDQVGALQKIAFEQLASGRSIARVADDAKLKRDPQRCGATLER
jgi:hypothetical protein